MEWPVGVPLPCPIMRETYSDDCAVLVVPTGRSVAVAAVLVVTHVRNGPSHWSGIITAEQPGALMVASNHNSGLRLRMRGEEFDVMLQDVRSNIRTVTVTGRNGSWPPFAPNPYDGQD